MKKEEELINTELLEIFRKDKYLKELAKIYQTFAKNTVL